jgi:hypothetical protein
LKSSAVAMSPSRGRCVPSSVSCSVPTVSFHHWCESSFLSCRGRVGGPSPSWRRLGPASGPFRRFVTFVLSFPKEPQPDDASLHFALEDASRVVLPGVLFTGLLLQGCPKIAPPSFTGSGVHSHTPLGALRPDGATRPTRSAFVVSHHPDGFRLHNPRRLVASCCRPWGSSGFSPRLRDREVRDLPSDASPFRAFPSRVAVPCVTAGLFPLAVIGCDTDSTSRLCSTRESVAFLAVADQPRSWLSWASLPGASQPSSSLHGVDLSSPSPDPLPWTSLDSAPCTLGRSPRRRCAHSLAARSSSQAPCGCLSPRHECRGIGVCVRPCGRRVLSTFLLRDRFRGSA